MSFTTPYQPTALDAQLLFACGVSYTIGANPPVPLTTEPYFAGTGFKAGTTQTIIQGIIPETAGCLIGQITVGNTNTIVLAFRGTMPNEINDWATDLLAEPIDTSTINPAPPYVFPGSIHSGFYLSLAEILPQIETELSSLLATLGKTTPIAITGHSKGGGMASLAAYYLVNGANLGISMSNVTVTTFAGPNPGDTVFAAAMAPFNQKNFINNLDIVPWLALTPTYASAIANYFQSNPLSNPTVQAFLISILNTMTSWNYASASTVIPFISAPSSGTYSINTYEFGLEAAALYYIEQAFATASGNQGPNFEAILYAHTHGCGGGYMFAVCPGACPAGNCPLIIPTVNALINQTVVNNAQTVEVDFTGNLPGTVFNWTNDNTSIGLAASGAGNIPAFAAVGSNAPVVATITVTPVFTIDTTVQKGVAVTFTITVNPA